MDSGYNTLLYKMGRCYSYKNATTKKLNNFLLNNIITRFGCPQKIMIDNAMYFALEEFVKFSNKYGII
jgi:hypothetical protein